jgi:hypothetical protein
MKRTKYWHGQGTDLHQSSSDRSAEWNAASHRKLTEYVARRGRQLAGTYIDTMSGAKAKRRGVDAVRADAPLRN